MESFKINKWSLQNILPGDNSYVNVLNDIFKGSQVFESSGDEETCIKQTRKRFEEVAETYKAPMPIPTLFRNHEDRHEYVMEQQKILKTDPKYPPAEIPVTYTFAEDIFANIAIIFSEDYPVGKQKPYILKDNQTKFVSLKKEACPEEAFEEAFSRNPLFYSDDVETVKKSPYVEQNEKIWIYQDGCNDAKTGKYNQSQFIVDVSVIYPENIWSTAYIVCCRCGRLAEIALCDSIKETAKNEIWKNVLQYKIQQKDSENNGCVIPLPITNSLNRLCTFREGIMGFTPLTKSSSTKPALFVRLRITYFTNKRSRIGYVLHERAKDPE